jgi:hypothetical protein
MQVIQSRIYVAVILICTVAGCCTEQKPVPKVDLASGIEVGRVLPASAWDTARAFRSARIPMYLTGEEYPGAQRILVRPEDRARAITLLNQLKDRPIPYFVQPGAAEPDRGATP